MTTKPTDQDRLNFLTHFRCSLEFDYAIGMWSIKMAKGRSIGSTPRKAIDEVLLINTGLWLADLSHSAWDEFHFEFKDRIRKNPETGSREAVVSSEDWELARFLDAKSIPYSAHWLPGVLHFGSDYWTPDEMPPVYPKFVPSGAGI